ncbi:MAG: RNA 2',3'-cyclic phosphodiesterase [Candidatus Micrarchaeota archaeon]
MRCFIAVELPESIKNELKGIQTQARSLDLNATFPDAENMHLTLVFLGELTEQQANEAKDKLQQLRVTPFQVSVRDLGFFPNDQRINVFWAGVESPELVELQKRTASALGRQNEKPFSGHITLARVKTARNLDALRELKEKHDSDDFGAFTISAIHFKKSTLTPQGPVYEDWTVIKL